MSSLYNRARVNTATAGTGTITLGTATSNAFFTFAEAGVPDGTVVSYVIEDGSNVELGIGTYTSSGTTLSRTTVTASKISGTAGTTKLTLSGSAVVYIDALAADITVPPASSTDNAITRFDGTTGRAVQNSSVIVGDDGGVSTAGSSATAIEYAVTNADVTSSAQLRVKSGTAAEAELLAVHGNASCYFYVLNGAFQLMNTTSNAVLFGTNNTLRGLMAFDGKFGWGQTLSPDRWVHFEEDVAATNTVNYTERLTATSTGTPANGFGVGTEYEVEVQAGVNKVGATVDAYAWDVTAASEDFSLVFRTMSAGAAATEEGRVGFMPVSLVQNDNINMRANYGMVVPEAYEIASGIALDIGAGGILEITA